MVLTPKGNYIWFLVLFAGSALETSLRGLQEVPLGSFQKIS